MRSGPIAAQRLLDLGAQAEGDVGRGMAQAVEDGEHTALEGPGDGRGSADAVGSSSPMSAATSGRVAGGRDHGRAATRATGGLETSRIDLGGRVGRERADGRAAP